MLLTRARPKIALVIIMHGLLRRKRYPSKVLKVRGAKPEALGPQGPRAR